MPNLNLSTSLNFDRGIESVSYQGYQPESSQLPERQTLSPSGDPVRTRLEQFLGQPSLASFLNEQIAPRGVPAALLSPGQFRSTLDSARLQLQQAADEHSDPGEARALKRAARLLHDDLQLHELLNQYRQALYQG